MKEVIKIGRKCKCRICTNKLTTDVAYCVKVNGRNQYYCSEEEYNKGIKKIIVANEKLEEQTENKTVDLSGKGAK